MQTSTSIRKCLVAASLFFGVAAPVSAQKHWLENPVVTVVKTGYQFLEGPEWADSVLLFSDIPANRVYKYSPRRDSVSVFLANSGNSNGLALDLQGNLLLAQHGRRGISRWVSGVEEPIARLFKGDSLNSPNDLAVKSSGSIFFTDPPYGITPAEAEIGFNGIYSVTPNGNLHVLDSTLDRPNGIDFSPDEKKLYVGNTQERVIYVWDIVNDSTLANKRPFVSIQRAANGGFDGLTIDSAGVIYTTGPGGIWVVSPTGALLDSIPVPGQSTNVTFGDPDGKSLYVTTSTTLYKIRAGVVTSLDDANVNSNTGAMRKLFPNPVQGQATIPVVLNNAGNVRLEIRSLQGNVVSVLADESLPKGEHLFTWQTDNLPGGMYLVHLTTSSGSSVQTCMVQGR